MSIVEKGKATQFRSGKQAAENGKKGGIASGKSRKKAKDMREALRKILDGTYTEEDGKKLNGMDILMTSLFSVAADPNHKQCIQAIRLIREILGEDIAPEQVKLIDKRIEQLDADIAYRKKQAEAIEW